MSWPTVALGEICEFLDSLRIPVKESERIPGPYPYYGANGMQGTIDGYLFDEPLLLLAEDGGHFAQPERGIAYAISGRSWVNNHAHVLRPKEGVDIRYLTRVVENMDVRRYVTGTTRAKLTKAGAAQILVPLPPLPEQRRIAAILDHADVLRAKRRETIACLDELSQSIFIDMFGDPSSNPRSLPVGSIGELVESAQYGTSEKSQADGEYPVLRMGNLTASGRIDMSDLKYMDLRPDQTERYTAKFGDLLFNRTNSPELVGKTAVYRLADPAAYAGYLIRVRTNEDGDPEYLSGYLNSLHGKTVLRGMCKSIVGMANINAKELRTIKILKPPIAEQRKYAQSIASISAHRQLVEHDLDALDSLFSSLQSRAFRGEL